VKTKQAIKQVSDILAASETLARKHFGKAYKKEIPNIFAAISELTRNDKEDIEVVGFVGGSLVPYVDPE
jgi:hypothetical protein